MLCSISGQFAEEPVVSIKSGQVFERRLIEKYITANGKCPITNEPLSLTDLLPLKGFDNKVAKPRTTSATSIPGMLQLFQSEWDAIILETFTLRQQLDSAKQELAHTLYRHDAACRVIARLVKERDEARALLSSSSSRISIPPQSSAAEPMEVEKTQQKQQQQHKEEQQQQVPNEIPEGYKAQMIERSNEISKSRKKREVSSLLFKEETIQKFTCSTSLPLHSSNEPGILCMDLLNSIAVTGGNDGSVCVVDLSSLSSHILTTFSGHTKKVSKVACHPQQDLNLVVSTSYDSTVRVWSLQTKKQVCQLNGHNGPISGLAIQKSTGGNLIATTSFDISNSCLIWDIHENGKLLASLKDSSKADKIALTSACFHPDGVILATGAADNTTKMWDLKAKASVVVVFEGHKAPITDISFSENGYQMATSSEDGCVKLWDLRKLNNFQTISSTTAEQQQSHLSMLSVQFDESGKYIGCTSGNDILIYHGTKQFSPVVTLSGHSDQVTSVRFGIDASFIVSTSLDRTLKLWKLNQ